MSKIKLKQHDICDSFIFSCYLGTSCSDQSCAVTVQVNQTPWLVRRINNLIAKCDLCYHFTADVNQLV